MKSSFRYLPGLTRTACFALGLGATVFAEIPTVVTTDSAGRIPEDGQYLLDLSADGRFTLFANNALMAPTQGYAVPNAYTGPMLWLRDNYSGLVRPAGVVEQAGGNDLFVNTSLLWGEVSADGRYVAFSELDKGIYVRDMQSGTTVQISRTFDGQPLDGVVREPVMSGDGRYVAFLTNATNLVAENLAPTSSTAGNLILWDRTSGQLSVAAVTPDGTALDAGVLASSQGQFEFSNDGRFLVYATTASNAHPDRPSGGFSFIYRRELATGTVELVTRNANGEPVNGNYSNPQISSDGNRIAFFGGFLASSLVDGVAPAFSSAEVFLKDMTTGETWMMSPTADGNPPNSLNTTNGLDLNGTGDAVVFATLANNFETGHTGLLSTIYRGDLASDGSVTVKNLSAPQVGFADTDAIIPLFAEGVDLIGYSSRHWEAIVGMDGSAPFHTQGLLVGDLPGLDLASDATLNIAPIFTTELNGNPNAFLQLNSPYTISPDGNRMAGASTYTTGFGRFYWDASTGYTFFGESTDAFSFFEILADDFKSGFYVDRSNGISRWTEADGVSVIDLGTLLEGSDALGPYTAASRDGKAIAFAVDPYLAVDGNDRTFVWSVDEGLVEIDLGALGFTTGIFITGISDDGDTVLGNGDWTDGARYANKSFLWNRTSGITVIEPLIDADYEQMASLGLSADGQVALLCGRYPDTNSPVLILRRADGSMVSLGLEGYFSRDNARLTPNGKMAVATVYGSGGASQMVVSDDGRSVDLRTLATAYGVTLEPISQITALNASAISTVFGFSINTTSGSVAAGLSLPFTELPPLTFEGPIFFGPASVDFGNGWIYSPLIGWIYRYGEGGWVWSYNLNSFLYFNFAGPTLEADTGLWFYVRDLNGAEMSGGQSGTPASWVYYHHSLWSVNNGFHAAYLYVATPPVGTESWHLFEEDSSGAYLTPVGGSKVKLR